MKKVFYSIAFLVLTAFALSSCTKEEIKPKGSGEGHVIDKGF